MILTSRPVADKLSEPLGVGIRAEDPPRADLHLTAVFREDVCYGDCGFVLHSVLYPMVVGGTESIVAF